MESKIKIELLIDGASESIYPPAHDIACAFSAENVFVADRDGWFTGYVTYKVEGGAVTRVDEMKIVRRVKRDFKATVSPTPED